MNTDKHRKGKTQSRFVPTFTSARNSNRFSLFPCSSVFICVPRPFSPVSHVHPTAIVDKGAKLGANVTVGPYTVIDGAVEVGEGTTIGAHTVIKGHTKIGRDNRIFHFCSIGVANQDKKYKGEPTRLEIGERKTI